MLNAAHSWTNITALQSTKWEELFQRKDLIQKQICKKFHKLQKTQIHKNITLRVHLIFPQSFQKCLKCILEEKKHNNNNNKQQHVNDAKQANKKINAIQHSGLADRPCFPF